ncbi:hypothetical protein AMTR_s00018p00256170 [Amborella trichopoda]|uniref:Uncharacterized protein n=1 Tax=Amborella trichopoda TaxID=13333 RepID=W1PKT6_AMBTC|nr:hypothetical protein AMTR_s00018p00256170 [Amborella trichopoda]
MSLNVQRDKREKGAGPALRHCSGLKSKQERKKDKRARRRRAGPASRHGPKGIHEEEGKGRRDNRTRSQARLY